MQDRCTVCHNLQRVRQKIGEYDAGAWNYYVTRMQENGARVTDSEKASIVEFLVLLESGGDL